MQVYRCLDKYNFMPKSFKKDLSCGTDKKKLNYYENLKLSDSWCYFLKCEKLCSNPHMMNEIGRDEKFLYLKYTEVNDRERLMLRKCKISITPFLLNLLNTYNLNLPKVNYKFRISYEYDTTRGKESGLSDTSENEYLSSSESDNEGKDLSSNMFL
ncbi:MAG: hypothetical protein ACRDDH_00025 [Cetobacterium sp.]|uniref:hypothetical protein n=1 Tax=Cetobacterium sp. TaxID=2071632 RepID=UPI003EE5FB72